MRPSGSSVPEARSGAANPARTGVHPGNDKARPVAASPAGLDADSSAQSSTYNQVSNVVVVKKCSRSARHGAGTVFSGSMAVYWPR